MQISKQQLRQIINEEIDIAIEEGLWDRIKSRASGVGSGVKGVASRAAGAVKYAATGDADSTAGKISGSYKHGKKTKIIDLHKKKIEQAILKFQPLLDDRVVDMEKDLAKLGVADSEGAQRVVTQLRKFSTELVRVQADFSKLMGLLLQKVGSGEMTQEE
tara:strand:+ start:1181 stop:1660 length:480 start_codon:yes stop_codon:yes gene_type:complete